MISTDDISIISFFQLSFTFIINSQNVGLRPTFSPPFGCPRQLGVFPPDTVHSLYKNQMSKEGYLLFCFRQRVTFFCFRQRVMNFCFRQSHFYVIAWNKLWRCNFFSMGLFEYFFPILLQINPNDYIPSFIRIVWGVAEKIMEESHTEMDKLLLLIGY